MLIGPFTQILTMDNIPNAGPIDDKEMQVIRMGGIRIHNGRISEVGDFQQMTNAGEAWVEIPYPAVVVPGFIDAHTHLCFAGSRAKDYALRLSGSTYQEISAKGGGILDTVKKTRKAEDLCSSLIKRCSKLVESGVTTCEVKSGYGLNVADELKMLQAIIDASSMQPVDLIPTCLAAHTLPWEYDSPTDYLDMLVKELLPLIKEKKLTDRIDIFVENGAFSVNEARPYLHTAKQMGFTLTIHADQFSRGGALLAAEMRAASADHLEASTFADFKALKKAKVIPIVLPGSSLGLGTNYASAKAMLEYGLPVAIASDWNPGSAPMGDLLTQAALLGAAEHLTMAETLAGITTRAAQALKLTDRGMIKHGMNADFSIFPTGDYREILYHQGTLKPKTVVIKGKKV